MFDRRLRHLKDLGLAPVARLLGPRLPPTVLTLIAFAAGLGCAAAAWTGSPAAALTLWAINRTLDGLDGTHARMHHRETRFGAYLDIVLDFVVYAAIPIGIAASAGTWAMAFAGLLLVGTFYVNAASWMYLAAVLEPRRDGAAGPVITMPAGLIGGAETVAFYAAFFVWPAQQLRLFQAMAVLVLITAAVRLVWARRHL